jgi:hypothetical protein
MNPPKKLTSQHQAREQQQSASEQITRAGSPLEFANAEDLLRHDALHTPVPPSISHRLQKSLAAETPAPQTSWWRRLFNGGGAK